MGDSVVARVVEAPGPDGHGRLALAGATYRARLPAGVREGQKLQLEVAGTQDDQIVLRLARRRRGAQPPPAARVAGALAVQGDHELLRAALALNGAKPLALPGGATARVLVGADEEEDAGGGPDGAASAFARVQVHSEELGPLEISLRLTPGGIAAEVRAEPGDPAVQAGAAAPELVQRLEQAVGVRAVVSVDPFGEDEPRPARPQPEGMLDVRA